MQDGKRPLRQRLLRSGIIVIMVFYSLLSLMLFSEISLLYEVPPDYALIIGSDGRAWHYTNVEIYVASSIIGALWYTVGTLICAVYVFYNKFLKMTVAHFFLTLMDIYLNLFVFN